MLATLLLRAGKVVPGEALAQALWDTAPPASARNTIQGHIKRLRRLLEPESARIVTVAPGYLMEVGQEELDLGRFTELRSRADVAARACSWESAGRLLHEALALWQGEPLSDVPSACLRRTEVQRLTELRFEALEARLDVDLLAGRHNAVIMELRGLVGEYPFRERLWERLMLALYRGQRQSEALAAYADVRRTLRTELGIDPNPELQRLHEQILAADPALEAPHRQSPPRPVPRELPADLNDFAGRTSQVSGLCEALANGAAGQPGIDRDRGDHRARRHRQDRARGARRSPQRRRLPRRAAVRGARRHLRRSGAADGRAGAAVARSRRSGRGRSGRRR